MLKTAHSVSIFIIQGLLSSNLLILGITTKHRAIDSIAVFSPLDFSGTNVGLEIIPLSLTW